MQPSPRFRLVFPVVTAILTTGAAASALADGKVLTGDAIESRAASGTMQVATGPGYEFPVTITLRADGTMEGVSKNGYVDVGRWWTRGDTLCHQWDGWFDGLRKCHAVSADGDSLVLTRPGARSFDSTTMKLRK